MENLFFCHDQIFVSAMTNSNGNRCIFYRIDLYGYRRFCDSRNISLVVLFLCQQMYDNYCRMPLYVLHTMKNQFLYFGKISYWLEEKESALGYEPGF